MRSVLVRIFQSNRSNGIYLGISKRKLITGLAHRQRKVSLNWGSSRAGRIIQSESQGLRIRG